MKSTLRRAFAVAGALAATAFACTNFDAAAPATEVEAGARETSAPAPDAGELEAATPENCASVRDARACVDFEPDAFAGGVTLTSSNATGQLVGGGAQGSVGALAVQTVDDSKPSSYTYQSAGLQVPFAVSMDVMVRPLEAGNSAFPQLLDIVSSDGKTRVYLIAHFNGVSMDLTYEIDGTTAADASVRSAQVPIVGGIPFDAWIHVQALVTGSQIDFTILGQTATANVAAAGLASFDAPRLVAGATTARSSFDMVLDNIIAR